jgi:hypothetical protein
MARKTKRLIISTLSGGLGNQMFQYAVGRALALRRGSELELDVGWLQPASFVSRFTYELGIFHVDVGLTNAYRHRRRERLREVLGLAPPAYVYKPLTFDQKSLELPGYVRLVGYWQNEKYFADCADVIRSDFEFRDPLDASDSVIAAQIETSTAVAVHVRRGDNVSNPASTRFHGVLPLEYYRSASERIRSSVSELHFFVFSDDPEWCHANLELGGPTTFVDHNQDNAADDLRLMTLCQHHIIANSTYSWWGAWLSRGEDKIVIAPKKFVAADVRHDVVPEHWVTL